jgi:hypothetical protein
VDSDLQNALGLIIKHREKCCVLASNPFVFALSSSPNGFINHSKPLRKFAEELGVKNMSTTQQRKYLATIYQVTLFG